LSVSPATLTITGGATGSQVNVTTTAVNSFAGTVAVAITGLPAGVTASPATLNVTPGVAQGTTLTAALTVASANATVTFTGTSGSLSHSAALALTVQGAAMTNAPDVTTYHYNVARDGLNAKETILTQANVNSAQFGKIGFDAVDGKVDAQPLYLANVVMGGQFRNVLYVATEHDSVYAFDADSGAQLWTTSILGPGETTSDPRNCSQITPEIGITSTPVIDRTRGANGEIFTIGMSKDGEWKVSPAAACSRPDHRRGDRREPDGDHGDVSGDGRQQPERQCSFRSGTVCRARVIAAAKREYLYGVDVPLRYWAVYGVGDGVQRVDAAADTGAEPDAKWA
jgi:hypothetical protein